MRDRESGRSRGFGFVTYGDPQEAQGAIDGLHEQELDGRRIKVNLANARGGGGGGGGGYSGLFYFARSFSFSDCLSFLQVEEEAIVEEEEATAVEEVATAVEATAAEAKAAMAEARAATAEAKAAAAEDMEAEATKVCATQVVLCIVLTYVIIGGGGYSSGY